MLDRLVLGSGSLGQSLVESLRDRPGDLVVRTANESRVETLVQEGIAAEVADPTDEATIRAVGPVDTIIVVASDPETNVAAARTARRVAPDALLVASAGVDGNGQVERLHQLADRIIDPTDTLTDHIVARAGDSGHQKQQLSRILRSIDHLAVIAHDNPDPDAIASAVALGRVAETRGCDVDICYYGEITHQENRAFVNLLEFDLTNLSREDSLEEFDGFALVDHSRPGVNDQLPEDLPVDIVIDHHPPRAPVEARYVDLQSNVGATSTLLVDYLEFFGMDLTEDIATGLLFGIRVDTREFTREAVQADFEAAAKLLPAADLGMLERIESPSISPETFDTIARAITNRQQEGTVLLSCVGRLSKRDALAQAADRLLTMDGVSTTVVYGIRDATIFVSARTQGTNIDLGEVLRDAFGRIGSAGGHADMAGAQITLGVLEAVEEREESLQEIVEAVVMGRFLEALDSRADQTVAGIYASNSNADEYLVPDEEMPGGESDEETPSPTDDQ
jgi:nanoRNase/pAp phosphatase (c-di-AMP/oligoRNAs hydrolase)